MKEKLLAFIGVFGLRQLCNLVLLCQIGCIELLVVYVAFLTIQKFKFDTLFLFRVLLVTKITY